MNNNIDPYEQMLLEDFKHNIMSCRVGVSDIKKMIEENTITENQMLVVEELIEDGMLSGLGAVAKKGLQGIGNAARGAAQGVGNAARGVAQGAGNLARGAAQGVKQAGQNVANTYQQGNQAGQNQAAFNQLVKLYDTTFSKALQQVGSTFQNNAEVADAITNVDAWMKYLGKVIYGGQQQTSQNTAQNVR